MVPVAVSRRAYATAAAGDGDADADTVVPGPQRASAISELTKTVCVVEIAMPAAAAGLVDDDVIAIAVALLEVAERTVLPVALKDTYVFA
jgi:hypothetical protein